RPMRWPGFRPDGTLVLPIDDRSGAWPARPLKLDETRFAPKRELHVTIVGRALGARVAEALSRESLAERELADAFEALDWSHDDTDAFVWLRKVKPEGVADSIIELVDLPALAAFHFALGRRLGDRLAVPPAHLTRWVRGDPEGIGVPDDAALHELTVRLVAREELEAALAARFP
ncbi:MAG TPA: hypothetical protein VND91_06740, partial [Candidatus Saccharimonadia bacterium]|nr:hypothetical protein [Candidatus Saccharimonadia bacterium]